MSEPAAIYCRISRDKESAEHGVQRQEIDCRALAERLGFEVVEVFVDNDISASTRSKKPRKQYDEMMRRARRREFSAIMAYSNSRLTRRPREFEDLIDLHESAGVRFHTVASGSFDLATADGRRMARFLAGEATAEAERTGERVKRAKEDAAAKGKYRGGRRPFGYEKDGVTIREREAKHLRHAVKALLAGRSLAGVVRELNESGSRTSTDKPWETHTLRPVLLRARNAGLIQSGPVWTREPVILGPATWPGIVTEDEWRAVHKLLTDPSRLSRTVTSAPRWLGSGIYLCGRPTGEVGKDGEPLVCGSTMHVSGVGETESRPNHKRTYHYKCSMKNHLTANQEHADKYVRDVVAELVRDPRIIQAMTAGEGDALQLDRERRSLLLTRLDQTEQDYDEGLIDGRRYKARTDKINVELGEVEERLAAGVQAATVSPIFSAVDPGQAFLDVAVPRLGKDDKGRPVMVPNPNIDIARAVLRSVLRVEVMPATAPRRVWKDDRLRLSPVA